MHSPFWLQLTEPKSFSNSLSEGESRLDFRATLKSDLVLGGGMFMSSLSRLEACVFEACLGILENKGLKLLMKKESTISVQRSHVEVHIIFLFLVQESSNLNKNLKSL